MGHGPSGASVSAAGLVAPGRDLALAAVLDRHATAVPTASVQSGEASGGIAGRASRHRGNPAAAGSLIAAMVGMLVAGFVVFAPALPSDTVVLGALVRRVPDVLAAG